LFRAGEGKDPKYLEKHIGGVSENLDSPKSHFVQKRGWSMVLLQINGKICFVCLPWLRVN